MKIQDDDEVRNFEGEKAKEIGSFTAKTLPLSLLARCGEAKLGLFIAVRENLKRVVMSSKRVVMPDERERSTYSG